MLTKMVKNIYVCVIRNELLSYLITQLKTCAICLKNGYARKTLYRGSSICIVYTSSLFRILK